MDLQSSCENDTVIVSSGSRWFFHSPPSSSANSPLCAVLQYCWVLCGRAHPTCGSHASSRENKQFSDVSWHLQFFSPFHSSASQTVEHSSCLLAYVYHTYSLALISLLPLSLQGSPVELTTLCCIFPGCECDAALHSCWDALLFLSIYGPFPQAHSVQTRCH